jgi:hypothetical protein
MSETDVQNQPIVDGPRLETLQTAEIRAAASVLLERLQFLRQAGITFQGDRDLYEVLGYDRIITNRQYRDRYARGGVAKRIVEVFPNATWRGSIDLIEDEDPKVTTTFEKEFEAFAQRLKLWAVLRRADILAGLSTYGVLLIGAPGQLDTELPKASNSSKILYLTPLSGGGGPLNKRQGVNATAMLDTECTIHKMVEDPQSERFGLPEMYQLRRIGVSDASFNKPVHWTRIIHIAEGCLDDEIYGLPVLENVWNLLDDLDKVIGGGAEAFWLRANQGLNLNLDKDLKLDAVAESKVKDEIDEYRHNISRVLKTRGMDVRTLGSDVANFSNPADAIITQIAGSKGTPKRLLVGSEMGELASSQDRDNWKDQVAGRQTGYADPYIVRPLIDRLIAYGYLPKPAQYEVRWPSMQIQTDDERGKGATSWAAVNQSQGETVFTSDEIRFKWYGMDPLTPAQKAEEAEKKQPAVPEEVQVLGGAGSGHFGHAGRPGEVGGSAEVATPQEAREEYDRSYLSPSRALADYLQLSHETVNGYLRSGKQGAPRNQVEQDAQDMMTSLDSLFEDKNVVRTLKKETKLYRGIASADVAGVMESLRRGDVISDKAFVSTSFNEAIVDKAYGWPGVDNDSVVLEIVAPKGIRYLTGRLSEREAILPRGTKFRVTHTPNRAWRGGLTVRVRAIK